MDTPHFKGDDVTDPKDDLPSLMAIFLCQATSEAEKKFMLGILSVHLNELSPHLILAVRDRIEQEQGIDSDTKQSALGLIEVQLSLRELHLVEALA